MRIILIQPPFVQSNSPYPAVHYLESFLRKAGHAAIAFDHSLQLYRKIFSRAGIEKILEDAQAAGTARKNVDPATKAALARYFAQKERYLGMIEGIMSFLSGGDPGFAHFLANERILPQGKRVDAILDADQDLSGGDFARAIATAILDDLCDLITWALDPEFSTVRYAERIASSRASFREIAAASQSYLMREFYRPLLHEFWAGHMNSELRLILISIPFPGCAVGAVCAADTARTVLGKDPMIIAGGGYVTTELRALADPEVFSSFDGLVFDSGYGGLISIIESLEGGSGGLHHVMRRGSDGIIERHGFPTNTDRNNSEIWRNHDCRDEERFSRLEQDAITTNFPDYQSADLHRYPQVLDSLNPMHRLWNDTPWLKYFLAHGCYWKNCSFCDVELDYVRNFRIVDVQGLMNAALKAAQHSLLHGIHFVDEAMPSGALLEFARMNRALDHRFTFWGNIRFDRSWKEDDCRFLAESGLVAVSGGLEIATERGLRLCGKGISLAEITSCLVAFGRAGILVHAYLIYGFPGQSDQEISDSMETVRQFFAAGLIDSAFWHRFVLTRHSRMYSEWKKDPHTHPALLPLDREGSFATNDLDFKGSEASERWTEPLDDALAAWMKGDTDAPINTFLKKTMPKPSVEPDMVKNMLSSCGYLPG